MKFTIWIKYRGDKRFRRNFWTESSKRASLVSDNYAKQLNIVSVKVVCNDGYSEETLVIK